MPDRTKQTAATKARLREAVYELLSRVLPVIRDGGSIPLRSIVEAVAGEQIDEKIRTALDAREMLTFEPAQGAKSRFANVGRAMTLELKAIKLKIPERLSGWAEMLAGDQGVVLHFDKGGSLSACKALFCVGVEAVEITRKRIFVDMEGKSFDRCYDLGEVHEVQEVQAQRPIAGAAERFGGVKTALRKAARARSNVQRGVRQTRASAAQSKKAAQEAGRKARTSAHEQFGHVGQPMPPVPRTTRRGHLGLTAYPVKLPERLAREHHTGGGLMVLRVEPDSPAEEAGLMLGDTLLSLDGSPMRRPSDLQARIAPVRAGQTLDAKVLRAGKTVDVTVGFGSQR